MKINPGLLQVAEVENSESDLTVDAGKNNEEDEEWTFQKKKSRRLWNIKKLLR